MGTFVSAVLSGLRQARKHTGGPEGSRDMQQKRWTMRNKGRKAEQIRELAERYQVPPIIATVLLNRGVSDVERFMHPDITRLYDPFLMKGMEEAATRILAAIHGGERIMVYGDYDVDGITSTACMVRFLRDHHADVGYYIPSRVGEGYGVNRNALAKIADDGYTLLITVDCGITAVDEVEYARGRGLDVIITDHHECKEQLPAAYAVVNPKQPGCPYPFKQLAGVGVAFKLLQAITLRLKFHMNELIEEYMDIVAIGTVADVMPVVDENRIIVRRGLELLNYTMNRGLRAIKSYAGLEDKPITTGTIGFTIAPRINAAGRIGDPKMAVEMLLANDDMTADRYANQLNEENKQRQGGEQLIFEDALNIMEQNPGYQDDYVIVLDHPGWHHGIIGIVASKIAERYYRPAILISTEDGKGKGSGRSIRGFNLFEALMRCEEDLEKFGGHELAAGLSLQTDNIGKFRRDINEYARTVLHADDFVPELAIDCELPIDYINLGTVERLSVLEPYGMGNPNPVFCMRGLSIANVRALSEGKHMKLTLSQNGYLIDAIGFNMGGYLERLKTGDKVDIAFSLDVNIFKGERLVQVLLKDVRFSC